MLSSLLEFFSKHINEVACGCLLYDLTQRVHSSDANFDDSIHVVPLIAHNNLDPQVLDENLYCTQLTLIINCIFLQKVR